MIGLKGSELTREETEILKRYSPGGVILFSRNIREARQVAELCESIYEVCEIKPFIGVDQEGGLVDRFRPLLTLTPAATEIYDKGNPESALLYGQYTGKLLSMLGLNLNFAPVVDLHISDADNALRQRYWGSTAEEVISFAGAYLDGLSQSGVLGCLKHFPGLGRTVDDSHYTLPVNSADLQTLKDYDLKPYVELMNKVEMIMVAHCHFPAFDPDKNVPASTSSNVYRFLRDQIGFRGIAITDDLGMAGISTQLNCKDLVTKPLQAGADFLPFCNDFECITRCFDYLDQSIEESAVSPEGIQASADRILAAKNNIAADFAVDDTLLQEFEELKGEMSALTEEVTKSA
jgi:beta-N-acetylhexosaminidase